MTAQPSPSSRLASRLEDLPDACRALLAALERQAARGGGDVLVRLHVGKDGRLVAVELPARYERRAVESGGGAT